MSVLPDKRCVDLAKHFLPKAEDDRVWQLALAFQEVAEEFPDQSSECRCRDAETSLLCPLHSNLPFQPQL